MSARPNTIDRCSRGRARSADEDLRHCIRHRIQGAFDFIAEVGGPNTAYAIDIRREPSQTGASLIGTFRA